jgi:hypothetical protein
MTGSVPTASPAGVCGELIEAYRRAEYRVDDQGIRFTMRIDQPCLALRDCLARQLHATAAYLTAWNPYSEPRAEASNRSAECALLAELAAGGWPLLRGEGVDPGGAWPPESSVLVLGIGADAAAEVARRYGQNAIVVATLVDLAIPRLLLLR